MTKGWSGAANIDVLGFELASNIRAMSRAWNMKTQAWLEKTVYIRTSSSLVATYFVSAIWHGFYSGYYLFFLSVPMMTETARVGRKLLYPMFLDKNGKEGMAMRLLGLVTTVLTSIAANYAVAPFLLLTFADSLKFWKSVYFFGHVVALITYIVVSFLLGLTKKKSKKVE